MGDWCVLTAHKIDHGKQNVALDDSDDDGHHGNYSGYSYKAAVSDNDDMMVMYVP